MKPVMLVILDGWGERPDAPDNAVARARTPNFDRLRATCPHALIATCGHDVGLPEGQMGNSEVGHLNIGAGRVVMQDLVRIDLACRDGSLAPMPPLRAFVRALRDTGGTAHLLGLVSDGGVHAHQTHAVALAKALTQAGIPVAVHAFTDGRDTAPRSALVYLARLDAELPPGARLTTVTGRYFAMDRDNRWERVQQAWRAIAMGEGERAESAAAAVQAAHARDVTDEFVPATVLPGHAGLRDGDGLLCFNFRADRAREILAALLDPAFDGFPRPAPPPKLAAALGLAHYSDHLDRCGLATLFPPQSMRGLLGEVVAAAGRTQLRMAETEKYPHVTYFLNGGAEAVLLGEHRILVPSPKVATYDLQPEMSAPELARKAVDAIATGPHDLIVLNFANADMVGHTGSLDAAIRAVEAVDEGLGRVAAAVAAQGGALLVTADHGNAEQMRDPATGGPHTAHTTNPVPVILMGGPPGARLREGGRLADLAPTLLALMGLPQPAEMTGRSLLA